MPQGSAPLGRRRVLAGAVLLLACIQYLVAEAVAAAAWRHPVYSYTRNYISDLGVPGCAAMPGASPVCSPLALVMNIGFVIAGLLAVAAALTLAPLIARTGWRRATVGLAFAHGVGSVVVGFVHSAPGTLAGTPHLHVVGAYLAIAGGNVALVCAGLGQRRSGGSRAVAAYSVVLGVGGLAAAALLIATKTPSPGLFERGAADTITVWEVVTGATVLVALRRNRWKDESNIDDLRSSGGQ